MSPQAEVVTARLRKTWLQWWTFSCWSGAILAAAVSLATLMLFVLVDALLKLPQRALVSLFAVWAVLSLAAIAALLVRQRRGRRSLAATARRVELAFPELESHLINLVQFAGRDGLEADPFRQAAIAQSAAAVAGFPFDQAATRENRWRRFLLCMQTPRDLCESFVLLALVLGLAVLCSAVVPAWGSSTRRILHPFTFVPSLGSVKIVKITPGDTEVLIGSSLQIAAEIDNPARQPLAATLFVRQADKPEAAQAMLPDETGGKYVAALSQILAPLQYRLQIGDTQTQLYKVAVYEKPTVALVEAAYEFPAYLERPRETVKQNQGDLEAPQFTRAELRIHPTAPIARGHLMVEGNSIDGQVSDDGKTLVAQLLLKDTTTYTIHLFTAGGHSDPQPRVNQVKVVTDAPPTVELVEPARETTIAVGTKPNVVVRASDDYGLGQVRIETRDDAPMGEKSGLAVKTVASWTKFATTGVVLDHPLELDPKAVKAGQTVWVRAVAQDRRQLELPELKLGPQESATPWQQIHIVAAEAKAKVELAQLESLRTALARILQDQLRARAAAAGLPRSSTEAEAGTLAALIRGQQLAVQQAATAVTELIGATEDPERLTIKRVVGKLAFSEMIQALRQAEALQQVKLVTELARPSAELMATQDKIIDVLRRLMNEVRKDTADLLAEMKKRPGTELPSDVQSKLKDLKDKLDEFLKQQKKVIEATESLAKKPVEDFTEKDKLLLKELAATEDEWAKFMADKHTDLSKLPEQDFANPSLLKELVEVQTELKMAKDALTKKTADIAVPLEQLGAEMAKEMTTNIEKWLPDTPDRERWSQEEPLTDDMKEAPMAELPKEMEDIVGKLMEDEEDLFNEMEDASSSWADSLDKGAGWDAMDGPISNNSARGVTGNRLPNSSEIAGRSGEGRQGKSSGEFVGDTAVGKGGRNTPSRLTPDAFVKGQVKDYSKDPVGGATGGGKESGAGGEGLHGPVPNRPERDMGCLATKQAQLRNKAEGVDLRFKVLKYHHNDLKRMIDVMAAVEGDLKAGRYRSALRRRDVLIEGLGEVKTYLKGEFTVRQDQTANLPTDIQKEILGSMQEPSPPGWEELNRQYFERLTTAPATAAEQPAMATQAPNPPQAEKK
ncbi:MAG: hypothetical protein ABSH35_17560 [Isosphaeraceae bacterium]|jgi:hypothetical protein